MSDHINSWIPVEEQLPEENAEVLLFTILQGVEKPAERPQRIHYVGYYESGSWLVHLYSFEYKRVMAEDLKSCPWIKVTHWMPLPEPPNNTI